MEIAVVRPDELGAGEVAAWHAMQDQGEEIRNPFLLEFLGLKDEYSEGDLEEALILHLEKFRSMKYQKPDTEKIG